MAEPVARAIGAQVTQITLVQLACILPHLACASNWMTTRTARINVLRGLLREQGILLPASARGAVQAMPHVLDDPAAPVPAPLRHALQLVYEEVRDIEDRIAQLEAQLTTLADADP